MTKRNSELLRGLAVLLLLCAAACSDSDGSRSTTSALEAEPRYRLANGCFALRSRSAGRFVRRETDGSYRATAASIREAEPFFLKPTALGKYLLYGVDSEMLSVEGGEVGGVSAPSDPADWTIDTDSTGAFRIFSAAAGKALATAAASDRLVLADVEPASENERFGFETARGCAVFPEAEVNSVGEPFKGRGVDQPALGFAESHVHITATDFLGGVHYGRPFHRFGVTEALGNCASRHGPSGLEDVVGNFQSYGTPLRPHDTQGWPTFKDWPRNESLSHEQTYYKWLERAWRGGLRLLVNFLVQNETLCMLESKAQGMLLEDCNEMDGARLQVRQIHDLEDYIDAQEGGPGRGWFRIVASPAEAREVINAGKLAVVLGIETSHLFDCAVKNGAPQCDRATIDRELDEFYGLGVRTVFPIHEFDNAYGGNGIFNGFILNVGNEADTGRFWETYDCPDPPYFYTAGAIMTGVPAPPGDDPVSQLVRDASGGLLPVYDTSKRQCNSRWITDLGRYLIARLMAKKVMIEIDHMELEVKSQVLDIAEAQVPPYAVMSGHGGHGGISIEQAKRIYRVGGLIFPYKDNGQGWVADLAKASAVKDDRYFFGMGYGADTNGLGKQATPRSPSKKAPVTYPFTLFEGAEWGPEFDGIPPITFDRQRTGERVFDTDVDGFAHYGMVPDFVEEVRIEGGQEALTALFRSAEAYLEMWERVIDR